MLAHRLEFAATTFSTWYQKYALHAYEIICIACVRNLRIRSKPDNSSELLPVCRIVESPLSSSPVNQIDCFILAIILKVSRQISVSVRFLKDNIPLVTHQ